jgi:molybdenum cofactor cytidylyltransferase
MIVSPEPISAESIAPEPSIGAVVLAAGMSRRMGRLKMLLPFGDRPMLARVVESLRSAANIAPIIVVTGHAEQEIWAAIAEYPDVARVHNPQFAAGGMLSSIQAGVQALPPACDAFFLVLGDQPMVRAETLTRLRAAWDPDAAPVVVPLHNGKRGHPVLISRALISEILALGTKDTLKTLMVRHAEQVAEAAVDDPATVTDIDTPEDYEAALMRWRETKV